MTLPVRYFEDRERLFPRRRYAPGPSSGSGAWQSATFGRRVQIVYGTAMVKAVQLTQLNGSTGTTSLDGTNTSTTPVIDVQFGLALGPITAVEGIVYEKLLYGPTAIPASPPYIQVDDTNLSVSGYPVTYTLGDIATAAEWSVLSGYGPDFRVPFGYVALLRCQKFACPDGYTPVGEVKSVIRGIGATQKNVNRETYLGDEWDIYDTNPADVIIDLLENARYGLGLPAGTVQVETGGDGETASSYRNFCDAYGYWIALGIDEDVQVVDVIEQILTATNSIGFWEGEHFVVLPVGDVARTANGATYTPVLVALEIGDAQILRDSENPVLVRRTPLSKAFNVIPIEWSRDTPTRDAELVTNESMDVADANRRQVRRADPPIRLPCIRTVEHALEISRLMAEQSLYNRSTYEFTLNPQAAPRIQVGDVLALTHAAMGISDFLVRVSETDEDARGELKIVAVEWTTGAVFERIPMANPIYDLVAYVHDVPAGGSDLARWAIARSVTFATDFVGSNVSAGSAATAETVLTVKKNGTEVGTLTFAISGTVPTMDGATWSVVADDIVTIENQATADASLAAISITLAGERTA